MCSEKEAHWHFKGALNKMCKNNMQGLAEGEVKTFTKLQTWGITTHNDLPNSEFMIRSHCAITFCFSLNMSDLLKSPFCVHKRKKASLAGVAQWTECQPVYQGWQVRFPVRAHAWVVEQVPIWGCGRGNHTLMFLSFSPSLVLSV